MPVSMLDFHLVRCLAGVSAAILVSATLAACGGDGGEKSSPDTWANDFCQALDSWNTAAVAPGSSLKAGNLSREQLQAAGVDVATATETLVTQLEELGRPDTEAGEQAEDEVNNLKDELQKNADEIEGAVESVDTVGEVPEAASVVVNTVAKSSRQIASTFMSLEQLDPQGELKSAFEQSSACNELKTS